MNQYKIVQYDRAELPLVTVIMPVYNTQDYLSTSVSSVLSQTYPAIELLCIDDGSTDRSAELLHGYIAQDSRVRLIQTENHGQGYARNLALTNTYGKYLMFLDSDDYLEQNAIETAVARLEEDSSDFCVFNWYYDIPEKNTQWYLDKDPFFAKTLLTDSDCLELLQTNPIFMVNKLFRTDFFRDNKILFSEGHIYEDNPPWFSAVLSARKVSIVNKPLYRVTARATSSTQTDRVSDWHCRSFLYAMEESMEIFDSFSQKLTEHAKYWIVQYFYSKFAYYYYDRTPKAFRSSFLRSFVDLLHRFGTVQDFRERKVLSLFLRYSVFEKQDYRLFSVLLFVSNKCYPTIYKAYTALKHNFGKKEV